jgi:Nif-specific regulatory protein
MLRDYSDRLMVGDSPKMQRVIDLVARVADSQANVLIRGESGTGKEMVARLIHGNSARKDGPFVAINCAALPETLLESELFGIERGVATGVEARPGKFELAKGGTVFLDEIGDIPLTLQAKLLRVLQEREIEKLGGRRRIPIDVRILSATHRGLEEMIERGEFRQDLYYRLKVVSILLPPLRDRGEDVELLTRHFLAYYNEKFRKRFTSIAPEVEEIFRGYRWPGNVRELRNLIERIVLLEDDEVLREDHLPAEMVAEVESVPRVLRDALTARGEGDEEMPTLSEVEQEHILKVLDFTEGNRSRAARILGISRQSLIERIKRIAASRGSLAQDDTIRARLLR